MNSTIMHKRSHNNKYSIMKGLAISGVVAGHLGIEILDAFVNYWHLPIFFFISGYFIKQKHLDNSKKYIFNRFKRLIVPFLIYSIIALLFHNTLIDLNLISGEQYGKYEYFRELKHILLLSSYEPLIGAIWFLPSLFIVSIISIFIINYIYHYKSIAYIWGG